MKQTIWKQPFLRNVATSASGTLGAQVLNVLAAPVVTRLYTPADLGVLAVFISMLSVATVAASLRFEAAIPLPKDDDTARRLVWLCFGLLGLTGAVSAIAVIAFGDALTALMHAEIADRHLLLLLPVSLVGLGAIQILGNWAVRVKAFGSIARGRLAQSAAQVGTQLGLGILQAGAIGLLLGDVIGRVSGSVVLGSGLLGQRQPFRRPSPLAIASVARRYARFPLFSVGAGLLNNASWQVPYVLMAAFFGIGAVGIFALAMRIMALPGALLEQAVNDVYTSSAAELRGDVERLGSITRRLALSLFGLGLPVFMAVAIAGPQLFGGIFGDTWALAGRYAQLLAPWFALSLVAAPLSPILVVRERQGPMVAFAAGSLLMRSVSVYVGAMLGSQTIAVALLAATGVVISLISTEWFLRAAHTSALRILRPSLRLVLGVLPLSLVLAAATTSTNVALIYVAVPLTIIGNYAIVARLVPELRRMLTAFAGRAA